MKIKKGSNTMKIFSKEELKSMSYLWLGGVDYKYAPSKNMYSIMSTKGGHKLIAKTTDRDEVQKIIVDYNFNNFLEREKDKNRDVIGIVYSRYLVFSDNTIETPNGVTIKRRELKNKKGKRGYAYYLLADNYFNEISLLDTLERTGGIVK